MILEFFKEEIFVSDHQTVVLGKVRSDILEMFEHTSLGLKPELNEDIIYWIQVVSNVHNI